MRPHNPLRASARKLLLAALALLPLSALADGGFGSHLFSNPLELLGPLLEIGGVALLVYLLFSALAFAFAVAHLVLLFFLVRAFFKRNFRGKGLRYSAGLLIVSYVALVALACALLRSQASTDTPHSADDETPLVHKLDYPLMLSGGSASPHNHLLPQGTSLYYDQAFPEGFVRYKVYINVEGVNLASTKATEKFWLDPLTAFPVDADKLRKLLHEQALTKEELASILKSGHISKEEIREILTEFSR